MVGMSLRREKDQWETERGSGWHGDMDINSEGARGQQISSLSLSTTGHWKKFSSNYSSMASLLPHPMPPKSAWQSSKVHM